MTPTLSYYRDATLGRKLRHLEHQYAGRQWNVEYGYSPCTSSSTTNYYTITTNDSSSWATTSATNLDGSSARKYWTYPLQEREHRRPHTATDWGVHTSTTDEDVWAQWNGYWRRSLQMTRVTYFDEGPSEAERAAQRERKEQRKAASRTARLLLLSILDDEQAQEFERRSRIFVDGSDGRRYMIKKGRQHNVFVVDARGRALEELCGHVAPYIPDEDNMLAQKLHIETDAHGFRQVCNIWDLTGGRRQIIHHSGAELALGQTDVLAASV